MKQTFLSLGKKFPEESTLLVRTLPVFVSKTLFTTHPGFQFADDALAPNDGVCLDLLQTDRQVLHLNFQRLLDGLNLDDALLFFMKDLNSVLQLHLHLLVSLIRDLLKQCMFYFCCIQEYLITGVTSKTVPNSNNFLV